MGLCIEYKIKLKNTKDIARLLDIAKREAKTLKWKTLRGSSDRSVSFQPHAECESVQLDFTSGLRTEGIVKTSFAPKAAHIAICRFLLAIKPSCQSLRVSDECGYWPRFNEKALAESRGEFDEAFGHYKAALASADSSTSRKAKPSTASTTAKRVIVAKSAKQHGGGKPMVITLGAATIGADGKLKKLKGKRIVIRGE